MKFNLLLFLSLLIGCAGFTQAQNLQKGKDPEAKVDHLEKVATVLAAVQHYDMETIQDRLQTVCHRRDQLKKNSLVRKQKLIESKQLQQFLSNMYEVSNQNYFPKKCIFNLIDYHIIGCWVDWREIPSRSGRFVQRLDQPPTQDSEACSV